MSGFDAFVARIGFSSTCDGELMKPSVYDERNPDTGQLALLITMHDSKAELFVGLTEPSAGPPYAAELFAEDTLVGSLEGDAERLVVRPSGAGVVRISFKVRKVLLGCDKKRTNLVLADATDTRSHVSDLRDTIYRKRVRGAQPDKSRPIREIDSAPELAASNSVSRRSRTQATLLELHALVDLPFEAPLAQSAAQLACDILAEPKVEQMRSAVNAVGVATIAQLCGSVIEIERAGGMETADGSRRRTPGGIFFMKLAQQLTAQQKKVVFGQEEARKREAKRVRARAQQSNVAGMTRYG
jgi:hypothetical protein